MELVEAPIIASIIAPLIFLLVAWLFWRSISLAGRPDLPPGSLGLPLIGETLQFVAAQYANRPCDFAEERHLRYGEVFKTNMFGNPCIFVTGAKATKMLTLSGSHIFDSAHLGNVEAVTGDRSILVARGEEHKRIRKITNEILGAESIRTYVGLVEQIALHTLKDWVVGQVRNLEHEATKFTLDIIIATLLSWKPGSKTEKLHKLSAAVERGFLSLPLYFPGTDYYKALKAKDELVRIFKEEMQQRGGMTDMEMPDDLMKKMLTAKDPATGKTILSKDEITHNMVTFIIAGHETSAYVIMFLIKYLGNNPEVESKLRAEHVDIRQGKSDPNAPLTWSEVKQMSYTEKVINETLRLANLAFWMPRVAKQDYEMEGYTIPKGWIVILNARRSHLMSEAFHDPESFNPSRFDRAPKTFSFVPFGMGDRLCIGKDLAKLELCIFIHHMFTGYRWKPNTCDMGLNFSGIVKPKGGVPIEIIEKLR